MRCPFCRADNDRVIDSRAGDDGGRIERQLLAVVKKGGVRDPFDRDKIKRGLAKACWKRPVSEEDIENAVAAVEAELYGTYESEVPSGVIGERIMELLKQLDQVAYVRFASVEPILAAARRTGG